MSNNIKINIYFNFRNDDDLIEQILIIINKVSKK